MLGHPRDGAGDEPAAAPRFPRAGHGRAAGPRSQRPRPGELHFKMQHAGYEMQ